MLPPTHTFITACSIIVRHPFGLVTVPTNPSWTAVILGDVLYIDGGSVVTYNGKGNGNECVLPFRHNKRILRHLLTMANDLRYTEPLNAFTTSVGKSKYVEEYGGIT